MGFTLTCQWEAKTISTSYEFLQERGIQHCKVMTMWILGVYGGTKILDLLKGHKKRQDSPALLAFPLGKCQVYHRLRKPRTEGYDQAISLPGYLQGMGVLNQINKSK